MNHGRPMTPHLKKKNILLSLNIPDSLKLCAQDMPDLSSLYWSAPLTAPDNENGFSHMPYIGPINSGVAGWWGQSANPDSEKIAKNLEKEGENQEKSGRKGKNRKGFFSLCPS